MEFEILINFVQILILKLQTGNIAKNKKFKPFSKNFLNENFKF